MIEGKNIILRLFRESDLEEYYQMTSRLSIIGEYWGLKLATMVQLKQEFAKDGFWGESYGRILITDKDDKLLGNINYFRGIPYVDGYELGFRIFDPEDRGKGIMSEAVKLFVDYLFALKPINRLQICFLPENMGSKKIAEKCGFTYDGTMRGCAYEGGKYHDIEMYSLLRNEHKPTNSLY